MVLRWNNLSGQWEASTDGLASWTSLNATNLGSGTVPIARLGNAIVISATDRRFPPGAPPLSPLNEPTDRALVISGSGNQVVLVAPGVRDPLRFDADLKAGQQPEVSTSAIGRRGADSFLSRDAANRLKGLERATTVWGAGRQRGRPQRPTQQHTLPTVSG